MKIETKNLSTATALRVVMAVRDVSVQQASAEAGIAMWKLSESRRGKKLTWWEDEKSRIAKLLKCSVADIFTGE